MGRTIGAVVLGYIVMFACVFAGLTGVWYALGADGAFEPATYDVTAGWMAASIVVGIAAAWLGGWVARIVGRNATAVKALAVVVLGLGLLMVLPVVFGAAPAPAARAADVAMFDAMQFARTPTWLMLLNPVIGAVGALFGGGVIGPRAKVAVAPAG